MVLVEGNVEEVVEVFLELLLSGVHLVQGNIRFLKDIVEISIKVAFLKFGVTGNTLTWSGCSIESGFLGKRGRVGLLPRLEATFFFFFSLLGCKLECRLFRLHFQFPTLIMLLLLLLPFIVPMWSFKIGLGRTDEKSQPFVSKRVA